ncbi:ABC transporter permease [Limisalsivibrio acetivorans]|uniref:ABC transporter permease n=1 Tax=Limisalsivibrio acetivorans TaxID=1304888 RepID=UPI0003B39D10|nr:ABC transporter permease [Limisalsivibrio acetivorans]
MSLYAFFGAIEQGLVFGIMALGVFITFRALDFPDLSVDGSFPMGAAISAVMISSGYNPWVTLIVAVAGGAAAGCVTAMLNTKLKILNLLSGILTMIALYSVNLRIMGMPNIPLLGFDTIYTSVNIFGLPSYAANVVLLAIIVSLVAGVLIWFFHTEVGLALRATGDNMKMVRAQGASTSRMIFFGVALSNGLVALSGALVGQAQGFADVNMGIGIIVAGLASVILGEALVSSNGVVKAVIGVILGSIAYRLAIAVALTLKIGDFRLSPSDLNLITAILVVIALMFPGLRSKIGAVRS